MPPDSLEQAFGQVVRELRLAKGTQPGGLCRFSCHRHRTYVSLVERGKRSPSIRTVWLMAEALDTSPTDLVEWVESAIR